MWAFKCGHWVRRKKQPISWGECVVRHRQRKSAQRGKITPIIFLVYDAKPVDAFVFFYSRARTSKSLKVHSQCSAQVFLWIFYFHPFFYKPPKLKCFKLLHVLNNFRQFHRLWNILNFLSIFFFICFTSLGNIPLRTFFLRDKLLVIRTEPGWSSK